MIDFTICDDHPCYLDLAGNAVSLLDGATAEQRGIHRQRSCQADGCGDGGGFSRRDPNDRRSGLAWRSADRNRIVALGLEPDGVAEVKRAFELARSGADRPAGLADWLVPFCEAGRAGKAAEVG